MFRKTSTMFTMHCAYYKEPKSKGNIVSPWPSWLPMWCQQGPQPLRKGTATKWRPQHHKSSSSVISGIVVSQTFLIFGDLSLEFDTRWSSKHFSPKKEATRFCGIPNTLDDIFRKGWFCFSCFVKSWKTDEFQKAKIMLEEILIFICCPYWRVLTCEPYLKKQI